jgi:tetratricopeptide (TPR) repeat protein
MKNRLSIFSFVLLIVGLCLSPGFAQTSGSVKGVCKDTDGKPIVGGVVIYANQDSGQKFTVTTNAKGEYFSLGITPGNYNVTLYKSADDAKANKEIFHVNRFPVSLSENTLDFDLKKEMDQAAKAQAASPEGKQAADTNEKIKKDNANIKVLNEKIVATQTANKAGDFDTGIANMTEATQLDATRDVLWGLLADSYRGSAAKQTDRAEKQKRLDEAVTDYQKAIDIKTKAMEAAPVKKPEDAKQLAGYYNNLGETYGRGNKPDDAIKAYTQAAQINPDGAAAYYFNAGAILTNSGKVDEANAMFDKCIAADPTKAEAYYQKGVNLMGKATLQGDKTVPAPGTVEALQKYLTVAPTGPNAQNAKDLLASLGSPVETSFGKKKAGK